MAEYLTSADVDTLYDARVILERLAADASSQTWTATLDAARARDLGRFSEACTSAENAVFRVVNVAASYLSDSTAEASHRRWLERHATADV